MKIVFLLFGLCSVIFADDLKSLLVFAKKHNDLIEASKIKTYSKEKELESAKSAYYPTLDLGAFYKRDDDATPFRAGTTYSASAKISFDIYEGGKKRYTKKQKQNELKSTGFSSKEKEKTTLFEITKLFYNLKSLQASLKARLEALKAVEAQLNRVKSFYEAQMATSDDVDRLQSAYDSNLYEIESLKYQILKSKKALELQVGKKITSLEDSKFKKISLSGYDRLDSITSLIYTKKSLKNLSQSIDSYYYPNIRIEDSFAFYGYEDKPQIPIDFLDNQNTLLATIELRVFDFGKIKEQKEAVLLQAKALNKQIEFKQKEQKMQLELSKEAIKTAKLNIKSSKSSLKAAQSALKTITKKYQAGVVDNIIYLDALYNKTKAQATYEKALNDLEIAYATYYYYSNKNLEDFLK